MLALDCELLCGYSNHAWNVVNHRRCQISISNWWKKLLVSWIMHTDSSPARRIKVLWPWSIPFNSFCGTACHACPARNSEACWILHKVEQRKDAEVKFISVSKWLVTLQSFFFYNLKSYLGEGPLKNCSVVVCFLCGWGIVGEDVFSIKHHLVGNLNAHLWKCPIAQTLASTLKFNQANFLDILSLIQENIANFGFTASLTSLLKHRLLQGANGL